MGPHDFIIFFLVVGARFIVPLFIPRFPLPAILLAMIIDAADQTIFQKFTNIPLDSYQNYDKALDIYYLAIAYLSTFKNWKNIYGFRVSRFLFYYRMIGDALFQITDIRALLFIFPNTFEYFFDFYEGVATRYDPKRLTKKFLIGAAAFIWIFIKLPQEWWIHIAQLDTTDFIKTKFFHVSVDTTFAQIFQMYPLLLPLIGLFLIGLGILIWWIFKKLPKADWKFRIEPKIPPLPKASAVRKYLRVSDIIDYQFIEKLVFVGIVAIIFAQIFPNLNATLFQIVAGVSIVVIGNALVNYFLISKNRIHKSLGTNFVASLALNLLIAAIYAKLIVSSGNMMGYILVFMFAYIITIITVLYDRYVPYYLEALRLAPKTAK
jgi:hypothetical protein